MLSLDSDSQGNFENAPVNHRELNISSDSEVEYEIGKLFRRQHITGYSGEPKAKIHLLWFSFL